MVTKTKTKKTVIEDGEPGSNIKDYIMTMEEAPGDFDAFFDTRIGEGEEYIINLYRVTEKETTWLREYINVKPSKEEIGKNWGGGEYKAYGKKVGLNGTLVKRIKIDPWWTGERDRIIVEEQKALAGTAPGAPASNIDETCKLINAITPLVQAMAQGNNKPQSISDQVRDLAGHMGKEYISLLKELKHTQLEKIEDTQVTQPEMEPSIMENLVKQGVDMLVKYGGKFMEAKGKDRTDAVDTIKSDPRFSKIMDNPTLIKALYDKGCSNKNIGVKIMNELYEACGCDLEDAKAA